MQELLRHSTLRSTLDIYTQAIRRQNVQHRLPCYRLCTRRCKEAQQTGKSTSYKEVGAKRGGREARGHQNVSFLHPHGFCASTVLWPLFAWALPENWRKGMRPTSRGGASNSPTPSNCTNGRSQANGSNAPKTSGNGHSKTGNSNGGANGASGDDLDVRILGMEKAVGTLLYRNILRECGRVNQPKLIRDPAVKRSVLQLLESAARGFTRLEAVTKRLEPKTIEALLAKLQAPPLGEIPDMKTLQHVVFGLEELAGPDQHHAA